MNKIKAVLLVLLAAGLMAGCSGRGGGAAEPESSGIYVTDAGTFSTATVEPYESHDYYKEEEWKSFLQQRADDYNREHGEGAVTLLSCSQKDGTIRMEFAYAGGDDLVQFTKAYHDTVNAVDSIRMLSIEEALSQSGAEEVSFMKARDGKKAAPEEIGKNPDYKAVAVEGPPVKLKTEGSIVYVSANVTMDGSKSVQTAQGKSYIIFK